jgi:hypothetical protein
MKGSQPHLNPAGQFRAKLRPLRVSLRFDVIKFVLRKKDGTNVVLFVPGGQ